LADYLSVITGALDGSVKRGELIANNIANVSTPGYKRQDIDFKSALEAEIDNSSQTGGAQMNNQSGLELEMTNSRHLNSAAALNGGAKFRENSRSGRNDENSVDMEVEMAEMAKNTIYYNVMSDRVSSYFANLNQVIQQGGK